MAIVLRTLATQTSAGALLGAFDTTNPANTAINSKIKAIELGQPEGTLMELRIVLPAINLPLLGRTWVANTAATQIAATLNARYAQGTLADPASGEKLEVWPKPFHYPVAVASGNTVTLRWIKLQAFAYIMVGILVAALGYLAWRYLNGSAWTLAGSTMPGSKTAPGPYRVFGLIPWYWAAAGAVVVGVPLGYWYFADVDRNRESLVETEAKIRRLREGS